MDGAWHIVIPVRLSAAKSRLSAQPAPLRRALAIAMALDVIRAAASCPLVQAVTVVGDDVALAELAPFAGDGATFVLDAGTGLNAELVRAAGVAAGPVAALLADVPCATPDLLAVALSRASGRASFVSDAEGIGTTLLAAPRSADFDPRFGPRSRAEHSATGAHEIRDESPGELAGLRRDVDSEVDLWDARRLGPGPATLLALRT